MCSHPPVDSCRLLSTSRDAYDRHAFSTRCTRFFAEPNLLAQVRKADGSDGFVPTAFLTDVETDGIIIVVDEADETDAGGPTDGDMAEIAAFATVLSVAEAVYNFEGEAEIELSIDSGDRLEVLALEDLTGNDEWCLVQNERGERGFVPKSFVDLQC